MPFKTKLSTDEYKQFHLVRVCMCDFHLCHFTQTNLMPSA